MIKELSTTNKKQVNMDDVLGSMVDCMYKSAVTVEKFQAFKGLPDRQNDLKVGIKPPRVVFYRKTALESSKPPPEADIITCTCKHLCLGALAKIKCLSCGIYNPTGVSYFCQECYNFQHPWYRVQHIFVNIGDDESIPNTLQIQNANLESDRRSNEGNLALNTLRSNFKILDKIADDVTIDDNIKQIGRNAINIEEQIINMRKKLRIELRKTGSVPLNEEEASLMIQRYYKGHKARKNVSLLYTHRIRRIWDSNTNREIYFNVVTHKASWIPPHFVLKTHLHLIPFEDIPIEMVLWCVKNNIPRRRNNNEIINKQVASTIISTFFRCIHARNVALGVAKNRYVRVWDKEYQTYFYSDRLNGDAFWHKPRILMHTEAPLLLESVGLNKRSPRINRENIVFDHYYNTNYT